MSYSESYMRKIFALAITSWGSLYPLAVFAQSVTLQNPLGYNSLAEFLRRLLDLVAQIGFPVIVLFIVYIGFLYIQAQGKADKLKDVHNYFFWALVGSLIVLGAQALSLAIQATVEQLKAGV